MLGSCKPDLLPNLDFTNHRITSPIKKSYNCIAWAADTSSRWWWPAGKGYWPKGVPREITLDAFVMAFSTLGYEACEDGCLEEGCEKIVLFARDNMGLLQPTHAAKQLPNGRWTSKLGQLEDIEHMSANDVSGPAYGMPVQYMRRHIAS